jgi:hypothetical protein
MPQSAFDYKLPSQVQGAAWTQNISVAPAGSLAAPLFSLYPSLGDVTISTATNIDTVKDGPVKVVRFGNLTVNALLSVTNRCRGLMILCDSITIGASGGISMTGKGAKGASNWPVVDFTIPFSVRLSASRINPQDVLKYIRDNGIWIGDPVFWAFPDSDVADCRAVITPGSVTLLSAAGCGLGGNGVGCVNARYTGNTGGAGSNGGTGGGASGGAYSQTSSGAAFAPGGGRGWPWGGGPASGAVCNNGLAYSFDSGSVSTPSPEVGPYGGKAGEAVGQNSAAGAAGNPGGGVRGDYGGSPLPGSDGTGGVLIKICRGNESIASGAVVQSDGTPGGAITGTVSGYWGFGGAGSGAGHISNICGGTYTNNGTVRTNGGLGGIASGAGANYTGAPGGAGSVVTKTYAQMGWS